MTKRLLAASGVTPNSQSVLFIEHHSDSQSATFLHVNVIIDVGKNHAIGNIWNTYPSTLQYGIRPPDLHQIGSYPVLTNRIYGYIQQIVSEIDV